ncbi:MAG TPA: trigger factor, partial [Candidatus Saccharimonadales bacterium]|nr:trigger factor [Candidatus Saccharimonadales bacterium]
AVNRLYAEAVSQDRLRPVEQPQVAITKFVPFSELELTAEVEVVGDIKLPDYKKIKLAKPTVNVTAKDVDEVIKSLQIRLAEKQPVERAAKLDDEVVIDFKGSDAETDEPIAGGDGTDYPLVLGSNSFIPGFEGELVGLKAGQDKTFPITFPKDYGVAALQNRKVSFAVTVKTVNELTEPKVDDAMAAKVGPFKTLAELKADIKRQVTTERQQEVDRSYESDLLEAIAKKTKVDIPPALVDEEIERQLTQTKQNLMYRGQTWQEFLKSEGKTEEAYRDSLRPVAELRVTAGLALSDIAEAEGIRVTPDEIAVRLQLLKGQYQDPAMQSELDKPETRRELAQRILSEKTIQQLTSYATK